VLTQAFAQGAIYQWTDEAGHTFYSDQPPPVGSTGKQLEMPAAPSAEAAEAARQRSEALKKQADELAADRRLREQRAAESTKQATSTTQSEQPEETSSYTTYPYYHGPTNYPYRPPIVRPRPPGSNLPVRPTHPIVRPGLPRR
jgi:hypothetical protein